MTLTIKRIHHLPPINIIANAIRILRVKFHCNRLTTAQDIQNYVSLIFLAHNSTQLNVNLRTQVKHLIVRIYLSKLNTKLYVTYYSY